MGRKSGHRIEISEQHLCQGANLLKQLNKIRRGRNSPNASNANRFLLLEEILIDGSASNFSDAAGSVINEHMEISIATGISMYKSRIPVLLRKRRPCFFF